MEKNLRAPADSTLCNYAAAGSEIERLKHLIRILQDGHIPTHVQQTLNGLEGLKLVVAAMTIVLTDYGGTSPEEMCAVIAEEVPDLYAVFGEQRVLAICEDIQHSEIPEQSAVFQEMYRTFNTQYFGGRLPEYRVLVVYDVWYWETQRYGYSPVYPPAADAFGIIDFEGRRILVRFRPHFTSDGSMPGTLLHEMAHAATDGDHGNSWKAEMVRLKLLGAPVED
jgi:hypothetical protein